MPNYDKLPLFPLHAVLFPRMSLPLHIFEERYRILIERCWERNEPFGVILLQQGQEVETADGKVPAIYAIGTTARIVQSERLDDGRFFIQAQGENRFQVRELFSDEPYLTGEVRPLWEQTDDPLQVQPFFDHACHLFRSYLAALLSETHQHLGSLQLPQDPALLSYAIAASLQVTLAEKQKLLEMDSSGERLRREIELLQAERETQLFFQLEAQSEARPEGIQNPGSKAVERTILRVDPSYTQYYFSKN